MNGHVLMDAEIIDTEAYAEFARKSPEAVAAHGGRVLVRTSDIEAGGPGRLGAEAPWPSVLEGFDPLGVSSGPARYADGTMRAGLSRARRRRVAQAKFA